MPINHPAILGSYCERREGLIQIWVSLMTHFSVSNSFLKERLLWRIRRVYSTHYWRCVLSWSPCLIMLPTSPRHGWRQYYISDKTKLESVKSLVQPYFLIWASSVLVNGCIFPTISQPLSPRGQGIRQVVQVYLCSLGHSTEPPRNYIAFDYNMIF